MIFDWENRLRGGFSLSLLAAFGLWKTHEKKFVGSDLLAAFASFSLGNGTLSGYTPLPPPSEKPRLARGLQK
jgi:hypothetical protein